MPSARLHLQIVHLPQAPFLAAASWVLEAGLDCSAMEAVGSKVRKAPWMETKRRSLRLFMAMRVWGDALGALCSLHDT